MSGSFAKRLDPDLALRKVIAAGSAGGLHSPYIGSTGRVFTAEGLFWAAKTFPLGGWFSLYQKDGRCEIVSHLPSFCPYKRGWRVWLFQGRCVQKNRFFLSTV